MGEYTWTNVSYSGAKFHWYIIVSTSVLSLCLPLRQLCVSKYYLFLTHAGISLGEILPLKSSLSAFVIIIIVNSSCPLHLAVVQLLEVCTKLITTMCWQVAEVVCSRYVGGSPLGCGQLALSTWLSSAVLAVVQMGLNISDYTTKFFSLYTEVSLGSADHWVSILWFFCARMTSTSPWWVIHSANYLVCCPHTTNGALVKSRCVQSEVLLYVWYTVVNCV